MSVQIKARITLPAIIHSFIGARHPLLTTGMQTVSYHLDTSSSITSYAGSKNHVEQISYMSQVCCNA